MDIKKTFLKKDRLFVFLTAGMVLPAAFLLAATLNLPHVLVICLVGLVSSMIFGRAVKFTDRSVIYSIVASLTLAVILDLAFPVDKNRFILLGDIFSTNITAPFLLYMAVIITFFEFNAYSTGVAASFSIFSIMLSSDVTLNTQQTEGILFFTTHTRSFNHIFTATIIIEIIFVLLALQPRRLLLTSVSGRWEKRFVLIFAVLFTILIGIGGYMFFRAYEEDFRKLENIFLRAGMRRYSQSHYTVFNKEVNLNRLLSPDLETNKNVIVLRAESRFAPGYLRGRVYTRYRDGKWTNPEQSFQKMSLTQYEGVVAIKSFFYKGGEKPSNNSVTVYPTRRFSSDVLLVPGNSNRFDLVADRLNFSNDGILIPEEWQKDGGYTAFCPKAWQDTAYPEPAKADEPALLNVPKNLSKDVSKILSGITSGEEHSDSEALRKIVKYFSDNYSYTTEIKEPPVGVDPVMNFMMNTKKGHCEFFATATVMLLRQQGIPARYVTGFVCDESHPSKRYYMSRLGDAHAWAEAYLRDEGRWVLVENTPPSGIPTRPEAGFWESWTDRFKEMLQVALSDLRRGNFAKAVVDIFSALFVAAKDFLWDPLRGPAFILLVAAAVMFYMFRRNRILILKAEVEPKTALIRNEYLRLEKFMKRRYGISRTPNMTISEWIGGFPAMRQKQNGVSLVLFPRSSGRSPDPDPKDAFRDDKLAKFAELARRYMSMRFRQVQPSDNEISEFLKISKDFKKNRGGT
ncbi:MAG: transglutaminase-like domain-containing protein [Victivallales bacterium]